MDTFSLTEELSIEAGIEIQEQPASPLITIHTHDRISFRRCRRKWNFSSPLRQHLEPIVSDFAALWFGSGIHFALEDYHGHNKFGHPVEAYFAYQNAFKVEERPMNWEDLEEMAVHLLSYYVEGWLPKRKGVFRTLWLNGEPMVEVQFRIYLPELSEKVGFPVYYEGTFDRIVIDEEGFIYILDYKTAARFDTAKLETDAQINAYCWAGEQVIGRPVEGMIYMQFLKASPTGPKILKSGLPSTDVRQRTTHYHYKQALDEIFDGSQYPKEYVAFLNELAMQESPEGDKFIRYDKVRRNESFRKAEAWKIYAEGLEMLTFDLPLYPNPTKDCSWDCSFRPVCLAMDDGSDPEFLLAENYQKRKEDNQEWRKKIKWPDQPTEPMENRS